MKYITLFLSLFCTALAHSDHLQLHLVDAAPVILTVEDLKRMDATHYVTELPWVNEPTEFTGVKLSTLLFQHYGAVPNLVTVRALNDYAATIKKEDIERYQPIIAYWQNGKPMRVREKGPFWLIYPLSHFPEELNNEHYQSQMVWQINHIYLGPQ